MRTRRQGPVIDLLRHWPCAAAVLLLAACGGGGDSGTTTPGGGSSTSNQINASNYVEVSQGALASSVVLSAIPLGAGGSGPENIIRMVRADVRRLPAHAADAPAPVPGRDFSVTTPCPLGGTSTITYSNTNSLFRFDAGDAFTVVQLNCATVEQRVTGTTKFTLIRASGDWLDSSVYDYAFSVALDDLAVTNSTGTTLSNGSLEISETSLGPNQFSSAVTADNASSVVGGSMPYSRTSFGFDVRTARAPNVDGTYTTTISASGRLSSSGLGYNAQFAITTVSPFVQSSASSFPSSGEVVLTGTNGGTVRITALDSSTVRVEFDADGNGSADASTTRTWSQLL